jgi:ABC-type branched-subunit amino acid transport system substrate-binding protein
MWISRVTWLKVSPLSERRRIFMPLKYGRITAALMILLLTGTGAAQNIQAVDSLFYKAIDAYQNQQYRDADQLFELLNQIYPGHHRETASLLMRGKCSYKLNAYQRALNQFRDICDQYPGSSYSDDAKYGMGNTYYRLNQFTNAVSKYLEIVEQSHDSRLMKKAAKLASDIMDYRMNETQLQELNESTQGEKSKAAVILRLAKREMDNQRYQTAKRRLENYMSVYPNSPFRSQFQKLLNQADDLGKHSFKIGVILPLSGELAEQGKGVLQGIQYAIDQHNQDAEKTKVDIVVRDSKSNALTAIYAAQELSDNEEVGAVIGELESSVTASIAGILQEKKMVLLAPTATEDGLTSIGSYIFQVNTSLNMRSKMLADYAVSGLGLKRFALLAPADRYGLAMRDGFVEKVETLGGKILTEVLYFEGAPDLEQYISTQMKGVRKVGIEQMVTDSLIVIVPKETLEEMNETEERPSPNRLYVSQDIPELVDSVALAVTSIDGIFLPVYSEDLPFVMPQLAYYNINAKIFGGTYWYNIEILDQNQTYVDGAVFLSDSYVNPANFKYHTFRDQYRSAMGNTPEQMEIYGYDTASLLLHIASEKALSRDEIRERLARLKQFEGIRGNLGFNEERINPYLRLLQYRVGKIYQIK